MRRKLLSFRLRSLLLGLDIDLVREIVPYSGITVVPASPNRLAGVMILRGANVTVVDPAAALFGDRSVPGKSACVVLIETNGPPFGLAVDSVEDVLDVDERTFEPPPPTLDYLAATLVHQGETMLLLRRELLTDSTSALTASWQPLPESYIRRK